MFILSLFLLFLSSESLQISLMRHANTINNQNNIYTGHLDIPIIQNEKIEFNKDFDCVLSSPMLRCKQTLDILNIKKNIIYDSRFIECGYGDLTGKIKNNKKFSRNFFNKPEHSDLYKSESIFDGGLRAYNALKYHQRHSILKEEVLVMSHKNTLKGLWVLLKLEKTLKNKNSVSLYDFDNLKRNIELLIENEKIPQFNNLELEKVVL
jgi:broad specificity phosphatase PhoE